MFVPHSKCSATACSVCPSISAVYTGHCVSSARERGNELQPLSSPGRGACLGPHPTPPNRQITFCLQLLGRGWGEGPEVLGFRHGELLRLGERSQLGERSVTGWMASGCQMLSGGSDQRVRHWEGRGQMGLGTQRSWALVGVGGRGIAPRTGWGLGPRSV